MEVTRYTKGDYRSKDLIQIEINDIKDADIMLETFKKTFDVLRYDTPENPVSYEAFNYLSKIIIELEKLISDLSNEEVDEKWD